MKDKIIAHLNDPGSLEKLYRADKALFKREFASCYPEIMGNPLADFWHARLQYGSEEVNWGSRRDLLFVIVISLLAGLVAKLPALSEIDAEFFYPRNIGFIVFPPLTAFFIWKNKLSKSKMVLAAAATLIGLVFINSLPNDPDSDTLILSCVHLLLFLWLVLGYVFAGGSENNAAKRLDYLKYNGDLLVLTALILIAGGIMTGVTIGLFGLIGMDIEEFYFEYIVIFALPAAPIIGTYLSQANPQLVGKVSPVIARIFSPLVLVMLVLYLAAMLYSGKDPYNDREFLLVFNALLAGVLAIIFFSVAGSATALRTKPEIWVLFLLSIVTIMVNGVALSAILFRVFEYGITPNRAAVMGGNAFILFNLLLVTVQLYKVLSKKGNVSAVGKAITGYLSVYFVWAVIVTFIFPFIFGFK